MARFGLKLMCELRGPTELVEQAVTAEERGALAIAAAVVTPVSVVLIDEVVDALADAARAPLMSWLMEIRDRGASLVVATNDATVQIALCRRVLRLDSGGVAEEWMPTAPSGATAPQVEAPVRSL